MSNIEYIKNLLEKDPTNENLKSTLNQLIVLEFLIKYPRPMLDIDLFTCYTYEDLIEENIIEQKDLPKEIYELLQNFFLEVL